MPRTRNPYPTEFRDQLVALAHASFEFQTVDPGGAAVGLTGCAQPAEQGAWFGRFLAILFLTAENAGNDRPTDGAFDGAAHNFTTPAPAISAEMLCPLVAVFAVPLCASWFDRNNSGATNRNHGDDAPC